jgi:hypothetical protein
VHFIRTITELTGKGDDLSDHELGDTAGVAERGVEHGDTVLRRILEVDLVGTDTEATHDDEVSGFLQHTSRELCLGTDTDDVDVTR